MSSWGENDTPLLATEVQYKGKTQPTDAKGYFLLTYGAIYIFKKKVFKGAAIRHHISLLQIVTADHEGHKVTFYIRDHPSRSKPEVPIIAGDVLKKIVLYETEKTEDGKFKDPRDYYFITLHNSRRIPEICRRINFILDSLLYKNQKVYHPIIRSHNLNLKPIKGEPKLDNLLEKRAILLSHFTFAAAKYIECAEYFTTRWKNNGNFYISKGFHPGQFARPFANAISWDYRLNTVCFDNAEFKQLNDFLIALLTSSQFIQQIAFANYPNYSVVEISVESLKQAINSAIQSWTFINCPLSLLSSFVYNAITAEYNPKRITYGKSTFARKAASGFLTTLAKLPKLRSLRVLGVKLSNDTLDLFNDFVFKMKNLVEIEINNSSLDGGSILKALTTHQSEIPLRVIHITDSIFQDKIDNLQIPPSLEYFDFSHSQFIGQSLLCLLKELCATQATKPFILQLRYIRVQESDYKNLSNLTAAKYSNIKEFDFSGNPLYYSFIYKLYDYLLSQKTLTDLIFEDLTTDSLPIVIPRIIHLCEAGKVEGLSINGALRPSDYTYIFSRLHTNLTLKRLRVVNSGGGNNAIIALQSLFTVNKNIQQIECDGFNPDKTGENKDEIIKLWRTIATCENIKACDFPTQDIPTLGKKFNPEWLQYLLLPYKKKPQTIFDRLHNIECEIFDLPKPPEPKLINLSSKKEEVAKEEEEKEEEEEEESHEDNINNVRSVIADRGTAFLHSSFVLDSNAPDLITFNEDESEAENNEEEEIVEQPNEEEDNENNKKSDDKSSDDSLSLSSSSGQVDINDDDLDDIDDDLSSLSDDSDISSDL